MFNGWGLKFLVNKDNFIICSLYLWGFFGDIKWEQVNMVLEGGVLEMDGEGILLFIIECLMFLNWNFYLFFEEMEVELSCFFGVDCFLWLDNGYLVGDDIDFYIDIFVCFCDL